MSHLISKMTKTSNRNTERDETVLDKIPDRPIKGTSVLLIQMIKTPSKSVKSIRKDLLGLVLEVLDHTKEAAMEAESRTMSLCSRSNTKSRWQMMTLTKNLKCWKDTSLPLLRKKLVPDSCKSTCKRQSSL